MKKSLKKLIIPVLAALLLAAALPMAGCSGVNEIQRYQNSINYVFTSTDAATRFFANDKLLEQRIAGHVDSFLSCDGKVGIARAGTGLYRVDGDGILKIYPAGVDRALLSLDNNIIVFTTATEVHIYDHRTGKLDDIKPEGVVGVASIVISPSGSTVGYSIKNTEGSFCAYAYENGESRKLSDDAYIMGIADKADFWYFIRPENAELFYASGNSEKRLGSNVSSLLEFNRDLTEVTFDMYGETYASLKGSEAKALVEDVSVFSTAAECESIQGGESCQASVKACGTLFGEVFYSFRNSSENENARTVYDLYYIDGSRKVTDLVKGTYQFAITEDRSRINCLVDDAVWSMDSKNPGKREQIAQSVYSFCVSRDGGSYYFIGYDLKFYYSDGKGDPVPVADNAAYAVVTGEGKCLFLTDYDKTGKLHLADNKGNVADIADGVAHIEVLPGVIMYYSDIYKDGDGYNVYDVYCSKDGTGFVKAVENALVELNDN